MVTALTILPIHYQRLDIYSRYYEQMRLIKLLDPSNRKNQCMVLCQNVAMVTNDYGHDNNTHTLPKDFISTLDKMRKWDWSTYEIQVIEKCNVW